MKKLLLISLISIYCGFLFAPPKPITPGADKSMHLTDTSSLPQSAGITAPPAPPTEEPRLRYSIETLLSLRNSCDKRPIAHIPEAVRKR